MRHVVTALVVLASFSVSTDLWAQEWLRDRENSEGPGVRLGDRLVLHPGLGIEGGYDTNFFHSNTNEPGAGRLRVTAQVDLATRSPQRRENGNGEEETANLEFRLGVAAAYYEYFSDLEAITSQRNVALDANLFLHLLANRPFSIIIGDNFTRTVTPQNEIGPRNFNRDYNQAQLLFQYNPGGRMLELRLGYNLNLNFYEDGGNSGSLQALGNYLAHDVAASVKWRFLPKTAFIFSMNFTPYVHNGDGTPSREVHDSFHIRANIGLVGLLTSRFSILAQVGYGAGIYTDGGDDFESVTGRADLRFHITPTIRLSVGYNREYFDGIFSDYYSRDWVGASYDHMIAGRVLLTFKLGFFYVNNSDVVYPSIGEDPLRRADPRLNASLFVEYRIRDWIAVNATFEYDGNFTDFAMPTAESIDDPGSYQRFVVMAGVRAMY